MAYICSGLSEGFDTLIPSVKLPNKECLNALSARKNAPDVEQLIETECRKGFLYGPFDSPPFEHYRVSPLGIAIGKYSGKKRLVVVDLSSPHEDPHNVSINELIDKESCSLTYVRLDDAIKAICLHGKGPLCVR